MKLVLFVSSESQSSKVALGLLRKNKVNADVVRLDDRTTRNRVTNGQHFSINRVPTLLVVHDDGLIDLFVGYKKISTLLMPPQQDAQEYYDDDEDSYPNPNSHPNSHPYPDASPPPEHRGMYNSSKKENTVLQDRTSNVMQMAKEMERQRAATLKYDPSSEKIPGFPQNN